MYFSRKVIIFEMAPILELRWHFIVDLRFSIIVLYLKNMYWSSLLQFLMLVDLPKLDLNFVQPEII